MSKEKPIKLEAVYLVYSGKDGLCCCGCAGKHYSLSTNKQRRSEVNDRMVKKVLGIVNAAEDTEGGDDYRSTVIGKRRYIVYFRPNR